MIMVWRMAGQVQGNANFLGEVFQSGKVCGVLRIMIDDVGK